MKKNILFILTDQHSLDGIGAYGDTVCETPNIDSLADDGVLFENAYTVSPLCTPARASLLTGLYPHQHGMVSNVGGYCNGIHTIENHPQLLPRQLEKLGYDNLYTGKWHLCMERGEDSFGNGHFWSLGHNFKKNVPSDIGFKGQDLHGHGGQGYGYKEFKDYCSENNLTVEQTEWTGKYYNTHNACELSSSEKATTPYWITSESINLMEQSLENDKPFFMYINFWGPHSPFLAPKNYVEKYRDAKIPAWKNFYWGSRATIGPHNYCLHAMHEELPWEHWEEQLRYYYAGVTLIDDQVGRLLEFLKNKNQLNNTIIIFSADHGNSMGQHGGICNKGGTHWDESMKIPLIIRYPNEKWANKKIENVVSQVDLYKTILDMAEAENVPKLAEGRNLQNLLSGKEWEDVAFMQFHGHGYDGMCQRTVRLNNYKFGWNMGAKDELYDLDKDPNEVNNLIDNPAYQNVRNKLVERLSQWGNDTIDIGMHMMRQQDYWDIVSEKRPFHC